MQANNDEDDTANLAQEKLVGAQKTSQSAGSSAECNKSEAKTKHKHQRVEEGVQACWKVFLSTGSLIDAMPYQLRYIDGYQ